MRRAILSLVFIAAATVALVGRQQPPGTASAPKGVPLEDLTWQEAETALRADTVVVIPLGAALKEHGPHLKLRNDLTMAEYLTRRVRAVSDVAIASPLTYHFYPAFIEYPGSTSLSLETARLVTLDLVRSLARFGPRRFYVLNTGISTLRPLEAAASALAAEGILLRYTNLNDRLEPTAAKLRQQEGGTHADEIETSMMLYIAPESVDMTRAVKDYTAPTSRGRLTRQRGAQGTYSPTGSWGDPTLATREKGERLVEALVAGILEDIEQVRKAAPPSHRGPLPAEAGAARAAGGAVRAGPSGCTAGDERTIRQIGDAFAYHWSNGNAPDLARLWAIGGDVIHPDGAIERTREVIQANRMAMFRRREYRGSKHPLTLTMIRCLDPDVAVADGRWELRGLTDGRGSELPAHEGQVTIVAKRGGPGWQIDAYRYTIRNPAAPPPSLLKRPGWPGRSGGE